ncbi:hypothetical protein DPMN_097279 [Dreissena polymorpha]|uniref:Uncharacterized protein n=1 Tax=Dreissena polymorpha TaxID=45954 RepID=A0A9D4R688_DREPO|nr:hypothetical protein DPMN_097279 [Dreissena polymorpha]
MVVYIYYRKIRRINLTCLYITVTGGWSSWSHWSECSRTCGVGERSRARICPEPAPQWGGAYCSGMRTDTDACQLKTCPGKESM